MVVVVVQEERMAWGPRVCTAMPVAVTQLDCCKSRFMRMMGGRQGGEQEGAVWVNQWVHRTCSCSSHHQDLELQTRPQVA